LGNTSKKAICARSRFTKSEILLIHRYRKQIESQDIAALHASIESQVQKYEEEVEIINENKMTFEGRATKVGTNEQRDMVIKPFESISSALFASFKASLISPLIKKKQVWIFKYVYPYNENGGCLWLGLEFDDGDQWEMVIQNQCRLAFGVIKRYFAASRYMPLKNPENPYSKVGDHHATFDPTNPAKFALTRDEKTYFLGDLKLIKNEQEQKYTIAGRALFGFEEKILEYEFPKEFHRSLTLIREIMDYLRVHNRQYSAKQIIRRENQKRENNNDLRQQMTKPVELMVVMRNRKIVDMIIVDERGGNLGRVNPHKLFDSLNRGYQNGRKECIIHEDRYNHVFMEHQCEQLRLDVWLWKNGL
jgi:hypothetical protein